MCKIKSAMVFAAGRGERMQPITTSCPKPLVSIKGRSMLDRAVKHLLAVGIEKVVINTHHLAEQLQDYIAHLQAVYPEIMWIESYEEDLLETGGGVVHALKHLGEEPFYTVNSDVMWVDGDVPALLRLEAQYHPDKDGLLLLYPVKDAVGYRGDGDFDLDGAGVLLRPAQGVLPYVYAGVSIVHPRMLQGRTAEPFSLGEFYRQVNHEGVVKHIGGLVHDGVWCHVGDVAAIEDAKRWVVCYE
jgi:MurNAc alpha-1-phosphate uridylyltransferase